MLHHIELKNFVIIEALELDFSSGMTALTGETGAGKSIILDAIELALGGRLSSQIVREGAERAEINIYFNLDDHAEIKNWLDQHDISYEDECIITRIITREGRSRSYINGQACALQLVSDLAEYLVTLHGQHQHQTLVKRDRQRQLLDAFAGHQNLCEQVKMLHMTWHNTQKQIAQLKQQDSSENHNELLQYQLDELNKLALGEGELEILEAEHKTLANAEQLINVCHTSLELLQTHEDANVNALFHQVSQSLESIANLDQNLQPICGLLQQAKIQLDEAGVELRRYLDSLNIDPERLQWVDERLSAIHNLARKHKISAQALLEHQKSLSQTLQAQSQTAQQLNVLEQQLAQIHQEYLQAAEHLHNSRQRAAQALSQACALNLQELGMTHSRFIIEITDNDPSQPHPTGLDTIEFLIATNPGQALQPLSKIASGGELSRISLAIQVITAQKIATPTLIFDEVDVGIGGKTAEIVGRLLRTLGQSAQLLCITHLPQVAVQAHHHLSIEKISSSKSTQTQIKFLKQPERVLEIARMLGGVKITPQTKAHAKEMLASVD